MKALVLLMILTTMATIPACTTRDTSREASDTRPTDEGPPAAPASFVNRVWVVAESPQVAQGELRVFLSEGTLVMASPHGTPAFGTWSYKGGSLKITEESQEYAVDILELTRDSFRIQMHSPGEPVVIRLAPAEQPSPETPTSGTQGGTP
jgi:hypothetical protein